MRLSIVLPAVLSICGAGLAWAQQPAPVTAEYGLIQGTSEDGLTLYRGIPFAAFGGDPNRVTIC